MHHRPHIRHPFTLLEVVIVAGLLGSVLLVLFMALHTTTIAWSKLDEKARQFDDTLLLDRTLDALFTNCIPFDWRDDTGNQIPVFIGTQEECTLAYMHRLNRIEDGAIRFCRLVLENQQLVAYYTERPPFPYDTDHPQLRRSVLARHVQAIHFSYADQESDDILFVNDWGDRLHHPLAIQLRIEWIDDETETTWLRRTAGSSYVERWGSWEQKVKP